MAGRVEQRFLSGRGKGGQVGLDDIAPVLRNGHAVRSAAVRRGRILLPGERVGGSNAYAGKRNASRLDAAVNHAAGLRSHGRRRRGSGLTCGLPERSQRMTARRRDKLRHGQQKRNRDETTRHSLRKLWVGRWRTIAGRRSRRRAVRSAARTWTATEASAAGTAYAQHGGQEVSALQRTARSDIVPHFDIGKRDAV